MADGAHWGSQLYAHQTHRVRRSGHNFLSFVAPATTRYHSAAKAASRAVNGRENEQERIIAGGHETRERSNQVIYDRIRRSMETDEGWQDDDFGGSVQCIQNQVKTHTLGGDGVMG